MHINNAQYSVLEASEDFMVTALILVSGAVTDRIGGAGRDTLFRESSVRWLMRYRCDALG